METVCGEGITLVSGGLGPVRKLTALPEQPLCMEVDEMAAQGPPGSVAPGTVSPDGYWSWNGRQWVPVSPPIAQTTSIVQTTSGYFGFAIGGAAAALIAVLVLYVASVVPYGTVDASGSSPSYSYSGFNGGGFPWYGFVNVIESTFALVAAVMILITLRQRAARAVASGAVLGSGIFAFFDWLGTLGSWMETPGEHIALGSILGVVGGLVLLLGGLAACLGLLQRQTT